MPLLNERNREYVCSSCFLVYSGSFDSHGREPCPNCTSTVVYATDTKACSTFEQELLAFFGAGIFDKIYWIREDRPLLTKTENVWAKNTEPSNEIPDLALARENLATCTDCKTTRSYLMFHTDKLQLEWEDLLKDDNA